MRIIPFILYLFLITFHVAILGDLTAILGIKFNMFVLMVTLVALYKGDGEAIWFGFFAGLVFGSQRLDLMPWEIVIATLTAIVVKEISTRINFESIASRVIIIGSCVLLHDILIILLISAREFFFLFTRYVLPGVVYTVILGWLFFMIKDGRITWQRVKALF